jgi:hypothetical protein
MNIPYRTRRILKQTALILLVVILVAALVWLCWFTWLKRYVVYTRDGGAVLDFSLEERLPEGELALPPVPGETVSVYYNEGENAIQTSKELSQLSGYYVDRQALIDGTETVLQQVRALERGTPVMLEVKSATGNFFYSSAVGEYRDSKINIEAVDQLIEQLDEAGVYLIAKLPSLRDRMYGLNNVNDGVFDTRGAYLFRDEGSCYWLNPTRQGVLTYLVQITMELKNLGFDEVVFDYFDFPDTKYMRFDGDKDQALQDAAKTLVASCASDRFAVSFVQNPDFALPEGRTRLYLKDALAADAAILVQQTGLSDPNVRVVFLAQVHDTRFDDYGVLRPLDAAH